MATLHVEVSRQIPAPPELVYAIVADYRNGHPNILPPKYFSALEVLEGGNGEGTRVRFQMRVMGSTRAFEAAISELEPGRVLVETDTTSGALTTFTFRPEQQGRQAHVTISTGAVVRGGLLGAPERWLTKRFLTAVYTEELQLLADAAVARVAASNPA